MKQTKVSQMINKIATVWLLAWYRGENPYDATNKLKIKGKALKEGCALGREIARAILLSKGIGEKEIQTTLERLGI